MADDAEAVDEELPDLEVIEEKTETSTTSAPQELFFIDKGKPKVIITVDQKTIIYLKILLLHIEILRVWILKF